MSHKKTTGDRDHSTKAEVKSAVEVALERASRMEDEPIVLQTDQGEKTLTFEEIKERAAQAENHLRDLQYKQAEFENFRKRVIREKEELRNESVPISDVLDVLEHLDRALESEGDVASIKEGVRLIRGQIWSLLEKRGVERIPAHGEPFDPNVHEAVAEQPHHEIPRGSVALEYQPGFRIGEKVVRPSKVVVSSGTPQ